MKLAWNSVQRWVRQSSACTLRSMGIAAAVLAVLGSVHRAEAKNPKTFKRIAHMYAFENTDIETETVCEIITATPDGRTLIYSDAANGSIGFVNIDNPKYPKPMGNLGLGGDTTSVAALNNKYVLAAVNTSVDYVNTSGYLAVIEIQTQQVVHTIDLGGQPDAVAVSPNEKYVAIAIENERDEDLGDGAPPQAPAGFVVIVKTKSAKPTNWTTQKVDLVGVPDLFPDDPEPEFVSINGYNQCVVTMQENNHVAIIDCKTATVLNDFPLGTVDLTQIDTIEDDIITPNSSLDAVPRESDAVAWVTNSVFATADEGDLYGGSRGWTLFDSEGNIQYSSGSEVEHETMRLGHYPEGRSENKGSEPEGIAYGRYRGKGFIFVGSERSSVVLVYQMKYRIKKRPGFYWPVWWWGSYTLVKEPVFIQTLPSGTGPEGLLPIPNRNLFVTASEEDDRDDKMRSTITIYKYDRKDPTYPTVVSDDTEAGTPIPWAALSALAADPEDPSIAYTIHDSFFVKSRIYTMDVSQTPAVIQSEAVMQDTGGLLRSALEDLKASLPATATDDFDIDAIVNGDGTVNLDGEGLVVAADGGLWVASEGRGNLNAGVSNPADRPFESPNILVKVFLDGDAAEIVDVVLPPVEVTENQLRFGYEGVTTAEHDGVEYVYVCYQRAWENAGDLGGQQARISRYNTVTETWETVYYPLDSVESAAGGWVGLSELVYVGDNEFAVVERDNQGNADAVIKRIYSFSIDGVTFKPEADQTSFDTVTKSLVRDIYTDLAATGGAILEKIEGMSIQANGNVLIVNDNDGVDDSNGETQLINLGGLFK
jgi:hypothetical protein